MSEIDDFKDLATEAKGEFDLLDRLQGRTARRKTVTVYTDEVNGEKHLELSAQLAAAKDTSDDPEDYASLEAEVRRIATIVNQSGITFQLRSIPPVVRKAAERAARKHLKIKGNIPAEQLVDYSDRYTAHILADSTESWTPHETNSARSELTVDEAAGLKEYLPEDQYKKLDAAMSNLSFEAQISDAVTADADF